MSDARYTLLRASAGTGKTYRLVEAYVAEVMEHGHRPGEVVAITFTRKAAAELRVRIRRALHKAGASQQILGELPRAPINNFHVLSLHWLRSYGADAGFPQGVEILGDDGADAELFYEAATEAWFSAAPTGDSEISRAVQQVAPWIDLEIALAPSIWEGISRAREDGCAIDDALFADYDAESLRQSQHLELLEIRRSLEAALPELTPKSQTKVRDFLSAPVVGDAPLQQWSDAWHQASTRIDRRGQLGKLISAAQVKLLREGVRQPLAEARCHELRPAVVTLSLAAWEAYQRAKTLQRKVDFADLVERMVHLLQTRPDIHRAMRQRIKSVLVDEAQDTNRLQRQLVHLLAGLSGPAGNESPKASLFVVGDRKQAIYTFRGADPEAFESFAGDIAELGGTETTLETSRRSSPELVAAINSLGEDLFGDDYDALQPLCDDAGEPVEALGRLAATYCATPEVADDPLATTLREAGSIAALVAGRVATGEAPGDFAILLRAMSDAPLYAAALGNVGLASVLNGGGGLYAQPEIADVIALIAWLTDGRDRLSAAIALRSPLFGLSDSALLDLFAVHRDGFLRLRRGQWAPSAAGGTSVDSDEPVLQRANDVLPHLVAAARTLGAAALLRRIDLTLDARATYLALQNGEQRLTNIDRLWELARRFDRSARGGCGRFALEQQTRIRNRHVEPMLSLQAGGERAVTISTVHQAKGLEYPVVILSDLRRRTAGERGSMRYARDHGIVFRAGARAAGTSRAWVEVNRAVRQMDDDERKRLVYVAMTRARRETLLFGRPLCGPTRASAPTFGGLLEPWAIAASQGFARHVAQTDGPEPRLQPPPVADEEGKRSDRVEPEVRSWANGIVARAERPPLPPGTRLDLPVTVLGSFDACLRRGFFVHDVGLRSPGRGSLPVVYDDPRPLLDPLARGRAAHQVLAGLDRRPDHETDAAFVDHELRSAGLDPTDEGLFALRNDLLAFMASALGRTVTGLHADHRRHEMPFKLALDVDDVRCTAVVRGQIDLLYLDGDEPVIIDYKHAKAHDSAAYDYQLDAYATAVAKLLDFDGPIRTQLVFLKDPDRVHERIVTAEMRVHWERRVAEIVAAVVELRNSSEWPGRVRPHCEAIGCGFIQRCHGAADPPKLAEPKPTKRRKPQRPSNQLSLF